MQPNITLQEGDSLKVTTLTVLTTGPDGKPKRTQISAANGRHLLLLFLAQQKNNASILEKPAAILNRWGYFKILPYGPNKDLASPDAPPPATTDETVLFAAGFAQGAHLGEFRRDGVTPYFEHLQAVVDLLEGSEHIVRVVAYLHDIVENGRKTLEDLKVHFDERVVSAVEALTKKNEEGYDDYLGRVLSHPIAAKVKEADCIANLCDNPTEAQKKKYFKALKILRAR